VPQNISEIDEFTTPLTEPTDSDPADLSELLPPIRGLANRTHNLNERLEPVEAQIDDGEWVYPVMVRRKKLISILEARFTDGTIPAGAASITAGGLTTFFPINLPTGCILRRIRMAVSVSPGPIQVGLQKIVRDPTPNFSQSSNILHGTNSGTSGHYVVTAPSSSEMSESIDNEENMLAVRATWQETSTGNIYWVELEYDDIGPRSF
jgi:hypothetical protein